MCKRLAQPFHRWQLAILSAGLFPAAVLPATAHAQQLDSVVTTLALSPSDLPRDVVLVGATPVGVTEAQWEAATRAAIDSWNAVACSSAELIFAGRHTARPDDDVTAIAFVDPTTERCFPNDTDVGWTLLTDCDAWRATDVLLNRVTYRWRAEPAPYQAAADQIVDLPSVITHELGHSLGLRHEDVTDPLATMAPHYLRDGGLASLAADDKLALCRAFPVDQSECDADDECAGHCVHGEFGAVCDEVRVAAGGYCDLGTLECASGFCLVTSPSTYSGYCTSSCATSEQCAGPLVCEDEQCVLPFAPREAPSCATAHAAEPSLLLLALFGWVRRRRR